MTQHNARLTTASAILEAAEANEWRLTRQLRNSITLVAPEALRGKPFEPQELTLTTDALGQVSPNPADNHVIIAPSATADMREFKITGRSALWAIKNTNHPLRTSQFYVAAENKTDIEICEPQGFATSVLRPHKLRGYMGWKEADKLSVQLLKLHPTNVWGSDAWLRCYEEGWQ